MSDLMSAKSVCAVRQPEGPPPPDLLWTCKVCGRIEPLLLPTGRYIRRSCACERAARKTQQEAQERRERLDAMMRRTYGGWLGEGWSASYKGDQSLARNTFSNYDPTVQVQEKDRKNLRKAVLEVQAYMKQMKGTLLLYSPTCGLGKTHLLSAVCNALREERGVSSLFATAPMFFTAYYDRMGKHESEQDLIRQAIHTPFLALDDMDKIMAKDFPRQVLYQIIDERVNARMPIGVTTNSMGGLASYIGEAAYSRLTAKMCPIELSGNDMRPTIGYK